MFEGFQQRRIATEGVEINLVAGGQGPPLLLIHGYPQTHVMWHKVAPGLARRFTVVAPDLRGYGDSSKPPGSADHANYSKRTMATDLVQMMAALGHERFSLAGHDRGARVAYRLALDHAQRVQRVALLDIIPTWEQFAAVDKAGALGGFHWYFLAQPPPFPETLIGANAEYWLRHLVRRWRGSGQDFDPAALAEYVRCFSDPASVHATCEDYRAGATIDCEIDEADRTRGARITAPLLVLWGDRGRPEAGRRFLEVWQRWAVDVRGRGLPCGHFLPEEAPEETRAELEAFFLGGGRNDR